MVTDSTPAAKTTRTQIHSGLQADAPGAPPVALDDPAVTHVSHSENHERQQEDVHFAALVHFPPQSPGLPDGLER